MSDPPRPFNVPLAIIGLVMLMAPAIFWASYDGAADPLWGDASRFKGEEIFMAKTWLVACIIASPLGALIIWRALAP